MPDVGGRGLSEEHARETARLLNRVRPDFIRVRTFALHPQSPMKKMVDAGTFLPMTDEEIVAEIRLLVSCLDEIHSYFSCGDCSFNLLMQVNGYLDQQKAGMLSELDKFLSLTPEQKKVYSLMMKEVMSEIEKLERGDPL